MKALLLLEELNVLLSMGNSVPLTFLSPPRNSFTFQTAQPALLRHGEAGERRLMGRAEEERLQMGHTFPKSSSASRAKWLHGSQFVIRFIHCISLVSWLTSWSLDYRTLRLGFRWRLG